MKTLHALFIGILIFTAIYLVIAVLITQEEKRDNTLLDYELRAKHAYSQCGTLSHSDCIIDFLKEYDDWNCTDGLCCGGNTIGNFSCI